MAYLVIDGSGSGPHRVPLNGGPVVIGRDATCQVCIADPAISRRHATLQLEYVLRDAGSTNGLFVAGEQVREGILHPGETVELGASGRIRMRLELGDEVRPPSGPDTLLVEQPPTVNLGGREQRLTEQLEAYRKGVERWAAGFLARHAAKAPQVFEDITVDTILDEVEQTASQVSPAPRPPVPGPRD